ncbi:FAD-binding oxidoreductase [Siculibacillus lacustris]|uniref:D-lactate dehydrogenase (cytochrome) n=1 Tax=Siculibacillus lacustris TaxID=1549641 RepID=A0A4Q9VVV1_9HYPH|nr:FAD-binding and (Fe-S)-binding domain-containing protein [Siculibacillus lacustris]TBW39203.1 FAD-binding oxidoreductase [Siculibacillus lacustris]
MTVPRPPADPLVADPLVTDLAAILPASRILTSPLMKLAHAGDASFYRLIPRVVVKVESEAEIVALLGLARRHATSVTMRAAGTSLSGQAVTDRILAVLGEGFGQIEIAADAATVRLGPAVVGGRANAALARFGRKIGPDPASIATAKIGGIAANNASGMCCGVGGNSYHTLHALRLVLADGTVLDTAEPASVAAFRASHAELLSGLGAIAADAKSDAALAARIRRKYRLKNTTGYAINALVDFDDPVEILNRLMIGSEGTLGVMTRVDYRTVDDPPAKASAFVVFADVAGAARAVPGLRAAEAAAVELLDRASLTSVAHLPGMPVDPATLGPEAAALLIEVRASDAAGLDAAITAATAAIDPAATLTGIRFSRDAAECARFWAIRKGTLPAVGANRPAGTTVIIEDVAFPVDRLAEATADLRRLFAEHGYGEAVIFGHALEGNLHFVFAQGFDDPAEVTRYARFMEAIAALVVDRYDGSLKAEHGTGRNMAPFVEREWGAAATDLMRRIKRLLDPGDLLNPGVVLTDDPSLHLKNLKPMRAVSPLVDRCIECGFCEPQCPSMGLTLGPRQRIAARREIARLTCDSPDDPALASMVADYGYAGEATCAACSLCATVCPVGIDTGALTKTLRAEGRGSLAKTVAGGIGDHFGLVAGGLRRGLAAADGIADLIGARPVAAVSGALAGIVGLPGWTPAMPRAAGPLPSPSTITAGDPVVFFPSCATRTFGAARDDGDGEDVAVIARRVFERAGFRVLLPEDLGSLCCGQPFASRGLEAAAGTKAEELKAALAGRGSVPVVFDTAPCASRMKGFAGPEFRPLDLVEFLAGSVLPRLTLTPVPATVAVHVTCSTRRGGLAETTLAVARACASEVIVPPDVTCCGFAGDKGFTLPELNAHALRHLAEALPERCRDGYSTSRTCEIGLASHSGRRWRSLLALVDEASQPSA